jgi:hypothetical protein
VDGLDALRSRVRGIETCGEVVAVDIRDGHGE